LSVAAPEPVEITTPRLPDYLLTDNPDWPIALRMMVELLRDWPTDECDYAYEQHASVMRARWGYDFTVHDFETACDAARAFIADQTEII
jgi:hypothetical protein